LGTTVPVYEYRCRQGHDVELLLPIGSPAPADGCQECGTALVRRYSRVGVRYDGWGFPSNDRLVSRPGEKDFGALREHAERIADGD
jgi:putative FmdB family regulatory protein